MNYLERVLCRVSCRYADSRSDPPTPKGAAIPIIERSRFACDGIAGAHKTVSTTVGQYKKVISESSGSKADTRVPFVFVSALICMHTRARTAVHYARRESSNFRGISQLHYVKTNCIFRCEQLEEATIIRLARPSRPRGSRRENPGQEMARTIKDA